MQSLQLELNAGLVSKETASTERGRDWEEERAKIDNEKAAGMAMAQSISGQPDAAVSASGAQPGPFGQQAAADNSQGMMGSSGDAGRM
jgi:hypothetical protein